MKTARGIGIHPDDKIAILYDDEGESDGVIVTVNEKHCGNGIVDSTASVFLSGVEWKRILKELGYVRIKKDEGKQ